MGAREHTRLVEQVYESFRARDVTSLMNALGPGIEWQLPEMENVPFAGTWRGHDGVGRFLQILTETQEIVEFRPDQFVAQGNTVIVLGHFLMRVKATGRNSHSDWAHVWTIEAGKVTHFREYVDTAAVIGAHSVSPSLVEARR